MLEMKHSNGCKVLLYRRLAATRQESRGRGVKRGDWGSAPVEHSAAPERRGEKAAKVAAGRDPRSAGDDGREGTRPETQTQHSPSQGIAVLSTYSRVSVGRLGQIVEPSQGIRPRATWRAYQAGRCFLGLGQDRSGGRMGLAEGFRRAWKARRVWLGQARLKPTVRYSAVVR